MRIYKNQIVKSDVSMAINTPKELQNPQILHMNRLSPRATLVPSSEKGVYYNNKEKSDRLFSLNGDYKFALYSDKAPDNFTDNGFDCSDFDTLDVPSMWQFRGYMEPTYPNVEYPFPFNPPYILRLNPVGCYMRTFEAEEAERAILHFEGVDNAFYVYLNGEFVGFSKGSRLPAEFDITQKIKKGENILKVIVYTYSDASYLENQDMLMASGIFRDVYIIYSPKTALWDWEIITDDKNLSVKAELFDDADAVAKFTFDGTVYEVPFKDGVAELALQPENIKLWNAETPNLYDLTLEIIEKGVLKEVHSKRVGFVTSAIKDRNFKVNGKDVLIRGINRHENNAENGRYITVEQIRRDLELIKSNNINAIRCAHYPNNPAFYEFCSELGIYVMDEGDIESHGCGITGDQGFLNKTPSWRNAFMDRTVRMVERDKNETCIVIWSMGNEMGSGENSEACAEWVRQRKDKKPVQYATLPENRWKRPFIGNGYCNVNRLQRVLDTADDTEQPLCLIEYAHAMGNSPGNMQVIWDYVLDHPRYCGGFVWEFRSHGKKRVNEDGSVDYLYGGDFHDDNHWSNFTLDGFCTSDGTPKPTFLELKYIYTPVRIQLEDSKLTFTNLQDFSDLSALKIEYEIISDGVSVKKEFIEINLQPKEKATVDFASEYSGVDNFVTFRILKGEETVGLKQFELLSTKEKTDFEKTSFIGEFVQNEDKISVTGENFTVLFANGVPQKYEKAGKVYFSEPMKFVTHRAETDNDGIVKLYPRWIGAWEQSRLQKMAYFNLKTNVEKMETSIKVITEGVLTQDHCYMGFNVKNEYTIYNDGLLVYEMEVKPFGDMPIPPEAGSAGSDDPLTPRLPRFGVCFKLSKDFETVKWYGRGEDHAYEDTKEAAPVGIYELPIEKMNFMYDVPQETGSRCDTRYVQVKNGKNNFTVYGNDKFSFQYHPWHIDSLRNARHRSEIKEDTSNYLYIDYKMRAIGSFSCGPNPERELDFEPHDFRFVFAFNGESADTPEYFLKNLGNKTEKLTEVYERVKIETERDVVECRNA